MWQEQSSFWEISHFTHKCRIPGKSSQSRARQERSTSVGAVLFSADLSWRWRDLWRQMLSFLRVRATMLFHFPSFVPAAASCSSKLSNPRQSSEHINHSHFEFLRCYTIVLGHQTKKVQPRWCAEKKKQNKTWCYFVLAVLCEHIRGVCNGLDCADAGPSGGGGPWSRPDRCPESERGCQSCCGAAEPGSTASTAGSPYPGQRIKKDTGLMGGGQWRVLWSSSTKKCQKKVRSSCA